MAAPSSSYHAERRNSERAFTLIELLVVIAILAILAVVVVLVLNPAELLKQSRDVNRLSDLNTLTNAIQTYMADQSGNSSYSLGTPNVAYISIPDPTATSSAGTDCSGLGFPSGGYFHCAASSTYRNVDGTGWIPVDFKNISSGSPLGSLPVDPSNQTSTNLYYEYLTDGTNFKLIAVPESQKQIAATGANPNLFRSGSSQTIAGGRNWVLVPGNPTYGTPAFWVMKYDAVCSDGKGNYLNDYNSGYDTYDDASYACSTANGRQISSLPGGWPIGFVSEPTAKQYCDSIGAHLLTNDEYMTIAMNAVGQAANWSGGSVGSGYVYSGHNDGIPNAVSPAGPNDADGYTGTDGPTSGGGTGTGGSAAQNQRRTLVLSDGSVIWDLAGNVDEHVQRSTMDQGDATNTMNVPSCSGGGATWSWCEFTNVSNWTSDVPQNEVAPPNSWNSGQGMGALLTYLNGGNQGTWDFDRGNDYNSGWTSGLFMLSVNWGASGPDYYIGFRCAR